MYKSLKSFAQITKPDIKSGKERLGCLDGIRFMSISWVALCHILSEYSQSPLVINLGTFFPNNFAKHSSWNMIINGFTSVDSFFLLSGCLVSYLSLKELERSKGRLNFFFFYLHRYLRYIAKMGTFHGNVAGILLFFLIPQIDRSLCLHFVFPCNLV